MEKNIYVHLTVQGEDFYKEALQRNETYIVEFRLCGSIIKKSYFHISSACRIGRLVSLLQDANNHTRMQIHRGHTPNEIMLSDIKKGYFTQSPIIVQGSTNAANILKSASVELATLGVKVDTEATERCFFDGLHQAMPENVRNKLVIRNATLFCDVCDYL